MDVPQVPDSAQDELTIVPTTDPDYDRLPWAAAGPVAWTMQIILGSMFGAIIVGALMSWRATVKAKKMNGESKASSSSAENSDDIDEEGVTNSKSKDVRSSRRATIGMTNDHIPNAERFSDEEEDDEGVEE